MPSGTGPILSSWQDVCFPLSERYIESIEQGAGDRLIGRDRGECKVGPSFVCREFCLEDCPGC